MPTDEIERINYYQRQFLGAEDFKAQQAYHRDMRRRHNLGHHTWGIVTGLELVEKPREGDPTGVDIFISPGMAVEGFGRELLVLQPQKLDPADFVSFTNSQHREVWIEFEEELARRPAAGYELCDVENQFGRLRETFRIVVEPGANTHDLPVVAGQEVKPPPVPPATANPGDVLTVPDESVPQQEFPDDDAPGRWLVRLGSANWDGPNRKFITAAADRLNEERRYIGNVTAEVLAPAGRVRIKDRSTLTDPAKETTHLAGIEGKLRVDGDAHFLGKVGIGTLTPQQMLSVEAAMNLDQTDANSGALNPGITFGSNSKEGISSKRIAGGNQFGLDFYTQSVARLSITPAGNVGIATTAPTHKLHINDPSGLRQNYLYLTGGKNWSSLAYNAYHKPDNSDWEFPDPSRKAVTIEMDDIGGFPRFQVWSTTTGAEKAWTQRFAVDGNSGNVAMAHNGGNVGIGTASPALKLQIEGDFGRDAGGPTAVHLLGSRLGDTGGGVLFLRSGGNVVAFDGGDNVGIGTAAPTQLLTLASSDGTRLEIGPTSAAFPWTPTVINPGSFIINQQSEGSTQPFADLALMRNRKIRLALGDNDTYLSSQGGALRFFLNFEAFGVSEAMHIAATGNVGVNTTNPGNRLHVVDSKAGDASATGNHVALIENASADGDADVLALKVGITGPTGGNNFITFFGAGGAVGCIEGKAGGVTLTSGSADFAEFLPRRDLAEEMSEGDLVGIRGGEITRTTRDADHLSVITRCPIVAGNQPSPAKLVDYEKVAFVGQVKVKVRGPVRAGDFIIPSGLDDGVGIALPLDQLSACECPPILGTAWESSTEPGVKHINTAIGLPSSALASTLLSRMKQQEDLLQSLRDQLTDLTRHSVEIPPPNSL